MYLYNDTTSLFGLRNIFTSVISKSILKSSLEVKCIKNSVRQFRNPTLHHDLIITSVISFTIVELHWFIPKDSKKYLGDK